MVHLSSLGSTSGPEAHSCTSPEARDSYKFPRAGASQQRAGRATATGAAEGRFLPRAALVFTVSMDGLQCQIVVHFLWPLSDCNAFFKAF